MSNNCFCVYYPLTVFVFTILFLTTQTKIDQQEFPFLTLPLLLALLLTILLLARKNFAKLNSYIFPRTAVAIFFVAIVWSNLVAFLYDYPRSRYLRSFNFGVANDAAKVVSTNSIFFTPYYDAFAGLVERDRILIANPSKDNFHNFPTLINYHFQKGHSVYAAFPHWQWEDIKKRGLVDSFEVVPIEFGHDLALYELVVK